MRAFLRSTIATLSTVALLIGASACGTDTETVVGDDVIPEEFPEASGQLRPGDPDSAYPPGPYGFGFGSVVPNYHFMGYVNPQVDMGFPLKRIELAEFYNPTGDALYPEGSVFTPGTPKPKALLLELSARWCPPCQHEADAILPYRYVQYKPDGEFLINLAENLQGDPAVTSDLDIWAQQYTVDYPLVVDPTEKLMVLAVEPAWPANLIVDARTMRVIYGVAGTPDAGFWTIFEQVIAGTHVTPE